ncbi:hypothetical protein Tco_1237506, partial [Tanacetum coccineum]
MVHCDILSVQASSEASESSFSTSGRLLPIRRNKTILWSPLESACTDSLLQLEIAVSIYNRWLSNCQKACNGNCRADYDSRYRMGPRTVGNVCRSELQVEDTTVLKTTELVVVYNKTNNELAHRQYPSPDAFKAVKRYALNLLDRTRASKVYDTLIRDNQIRVVIDHHKHQKMNARTQRCVTQ